MTKDADAVIVGVHVSSKDHIYPLMKHFNLMGVASSRMRVPPSLGHKGSLDGLMYENDMNRMMLITCCGLHSQTVSPPPPSSKHQVRKSLLEEWCSSPPVEFRDLEDQCCVH